MGNDQRDVEDDGMILAGAAKALREVRDALRREPTDEHLRAAEANLVHEMERVTQNSEEATC